MLRRSPQAVLLWCAALVVAVITAASVGGTLASLRRQDQRYGRVRDFLVAARDLPVGSTLTAGDVRIARTRGDAFATGTLTSRGTADGRVVTVTLLRGDPVTKRHLASRRRDGLDGVVAPGWRAMRVPVEDGVHVRPGDHVDVFVTFDPAKIAPDVDPTLTVASAVPVLAVDRAGSASSAGGSNRLGVTLMIADEEARRLAYATANGVVALALVPPEEARDPTTRG